MRQKIKRIQKLESAEEPDDHAKHVGQPSWDDKAL